MVSSSAPRHRRSVACNPRHHHSVASNPRHCRSAAYNPHAAVTLWLATHATAALFWCPSSGGDLRPHPLLWRGTQDSDFFMAFSAVPPDFQVPCEDEAPLPPPPSPPPPPPVCTPFTGIDVSLAYAQLAHNNINRRGPHQWNDATDPEGMRFVNIGQMGDFYVVRTARFDPDPCYSLHHRRLYLYDPPSTPPPPRLPPLKYISQPPCLFCSGTKQRSSALAQRARLICRRPCGQPTWLLAATGPPP